MSDTIMVDAVQTVHDSLKTFLRDQMKAKPDHYGSDFVQANVAENLFEMYFGANFYAELFQPDGYWDFAWLLLHARELDLVTPEQDDDVCAALGEIWDSLSTPEQIELEDKIGKL